MRQGDVGGRKRGRMRQGNVGGGRKRGRMRQGRGERCWEEERRKNEKGVGGG